MNERYEIILVIYRGRRQLEDFLGCLPAEASLVVVDNSYHDDDVRDLLTARPDTRHIDSGGNVGFSVAANLGARASEAPVLIFFNPDTRPTPEVLEELAGYLESHPGCASCGALGGGQEPGVLRVAAHVLELDRLWPAAGLYVEPQPGRTIRVDWVHGACWAVRRNVFLESGGFDPRYFIYPSDIDLGCRLSRAGHQQVVLGDLPVAHAGVGSSEDFTPATGWEKMGEGWTRYLRNEYGAVRRGLMLALFAAGYAARGLLYTALGREAIAVQMRALVRGIAGEVRRHGV